MKQDRVIDDPEQDKLADDVVDWLKATDEANTAHTPRSELDDEARHEKHFCLGFQFALDELLQGSGIRCWGVIPDGHGRGYRVTCKDAAGREYQADVSFDEWLDTQARLGRDAGLKMIAIVGDRVLAARERYFERMQ